MLCNQNAPSQPATPSVLAITPTILFESIFADFFTCLGHHFLLAGDRLSSWVEVYRVPHGTNTAGSKRIISALRSLFAIFGVPEDPSIKRASRSSSQKCKRLLMENIGPNGSLDKTRENERFLRALLQVGKLPIRIVGYLLQRFSLDTRRVFIRQQAL